MSKANVFLILLSFNLFILLSCDTKKNERRDRFGQSERINTEENRFSHYQVLSKDTEIIKAVYTEWFTTDRPKFITLENYRKHENKDDLVDYCFFVDSKNTALLKFPEEIKNDLQNGKPVLFYGKYYRTKKFDDLYPNKVFEMQRESGNLSYEPKDGYFKVFVIEKYERSK